MTTYTWKNPVTGDWGTDGNWDQPGAPNDAAAVAALIVGSYTVTISAGESFTINALNQPGSFFLTDTLPNLIVAGTLDLTGTTASTVNYPTGFVPTNSATVSAGGTVEGEGDLNGFETLVNAGLLLANAGNNGNLLFQGITSLTNQGTAETTGGSILQLTSPNLTNLSNGTLSGGTWIALSNATQASLIAIEGTTSSGITADAAAITLDNGSQLNVYNQNSQPIVLESTLTTITAAGSLVLLNQRGYSTTQTLTDDGVLDVQGGTFATGGLVVGNGGSFIGHGTVTGAVSDTGVIEVKGGFLLLQQVISGAGQVVVDGSGLLGLVGGAYGVNVVNNGWVEAQSGDVVLSGNVGGNGTLLIEGQTQVGTMAAAPTTLDLAAGQSDAVVFNGAGGVLQLDSPTAFTGVVTGFGQGDTIDLGGVVANSATLNNGTLDVLNNGSTVDTIALAGSYAAATQFSVGTLATGGSSITLTGQQPQDFSFTGGRWPTTTITWTFATSTFSSDNSASFSHFINSTSAIADIVRSAFAEWAQIGGFQFQFVPDSSTQAGAPDIRVGFGDLTGSTGEIGQADYQYPNGVLLPDAIVRLEDPSVKAVVADSGVTGGLVYSGVQSTVYQVAVHEIGHALGLNHSTDTNAVMNPTARGVTNQTPDASDVTAIHVLYPACYAAGTRILAENGDRAIETLRPGDRLATPLASGGFRAVRWVGRRTLRPDGQRVPADFHPVRIRAHAFGPGLPVRDLVLSPNHAIHADDGAEGALVPVRCLIDGRAVVQERVEMVSYYHVELEDGGAPVHEVIVAEGLYAESYLDTGNRAAFQDEAAGIATGPAMAARAWAALGCAPLVTAGPVVARLRARLAAGWRRAA